MTQIPHAQFKAMRLLCGLTLEDVAQELGVNRRTVSSWEEYSDESPVPGYASNFIMEEARLLIERVAHTLNELQEIERQHGAPECCDMSYQKGETQDERKINATTRLVAACLLMDRQELSIRYGSETVPSIEVAKKVNQK